jgi:chaperonin GroEL
MAILSKLANQSSKTGFYCCSVKAPLTGEHRDAIMEDIAKFTNGVYIRHAEGSKLEFNPENKEEAEKALKQLGKAKKIKVNRNQTIIYNGFCDPVVFEEHCDDLFGAQEVEQDLETKAFLQERLARLTSGIIEILVGGATEAETKERKDRVEDALNACRAAKEEGVLPGGGVALLRVSSMSFDNLNPKNEGQKVGITILKNALRVPIRQLAINAVSNPDEVIKKIEESEDLDFGWDIAIDRYGNMYEFGILDPLKAVRSALEGASSIAALMLGNGCTIVDHVVMTPSGQLAPQYII